MYVHTYGNMDMDMDGWMDTTACAHTHLYMYIFIYSCRYNHTSYSDTNSKAAYLIYIHSNCFPHLVFDVFSDISFDTNFDTFSDITMAWIRSCF